jgi:hypothetical protein
MSNLKKPKCTSVKSEIKITIKIMSKIIWVTIPVRFSLTLDLNLNLNPVLALVFPRSSGFLLLVILI